MTAADFRGARSAAAADSRRPSPPVLPLASVISEAARPGEAGTAAAGRGNGRAPETAAEDGRFEFREIEIEGRSYRWQVFVPGAVASGEDRNPAVILFLHGAGQRGSDGERQTEIGLPAVLRERPDFPAVVVMPQSPRSAWWGNPRIEALALAALDRAIAEFGGDPDRIYLTGLSLGGYGTWAFAYRYPDRFAALVPVCGGVTPRNSRLPTPDWHPGAVRPDDPFGEAAGVLAGIPVWIFHGDRDRRIPVTESRRMAEALRAAGGSPRYTEYPGVGHDSWTPAYREEGLYEWLFAQRLSDRSP